MNFAALLTPIHTNNIFGRARFEFYKQMLLLLEPCYESWRCLKAGWYCARCENQHGVLTHPRFWQSTSASDSLEKVNLFSHGLSQTRSKIGYLKVRWSIITFPTFSHVFAMISGHSERNGCEWKLRYQWNHLTSSNYSYNIYHRSYLVGGLEHVFSTYW